MKISLLALFVFLSLVSFQARSVLPKAMIEHISNNLSVCELYQLSRQGSISHASTYFHLQYWSKDNIKNGLIAPLLRRQKINLRHSIHLQKEYSTSFQTAKALTVVLKGMTVAGIPHFNKEHFLNTIESLYESRKVADGVSTCISIKWGNKYSDLHAWPLFNNTVQKMDHIFAESKKSDLSLKERQNANRFGLSDGEYAELQALSVAGALFEKQFEFLANDRGSWRGNLIENPFVCTDEAHTHYNFLAFVQEQGWLEYFEVREGILAHRRPGVLQDHFSVMLFRKRDNRSFVYDSWHLDGGEPIVIASLEHWIMSQDLENRIIPYESAKILLERIKTGLQVVSDDRVRPRGGSEDFHFSLRYRDL